MIMNVLDHAGYSGTSFSCHN